MTAIYNFFINYGFVFELVLSFSLFTFFFSRRKLFVLRFAACVACLFAFSWLRDATPGGNAWFQALKYFILYALCLGSLFFLFQEPARNILFAFIGASLTQHCAFKLGDLVRYVIAPQTAIVNSVVYCGIVVAVNLLIYIFLARRRQGGLEGMPLAPTLALGGAMLVVCVLFQQLFEVYGEDGGLPMYALFSSFDFIATLIILCLQYAVLYSSRMRQEYRMTEHLLYLQQAQMETSKETINLINIKCHDLKKMIGSLGEKMHIEEGEVEEMRRAINIYDGAVKTGNEALDILLAEKSFICQDKEIQFNCIVDGKCLGFMKTSDIYSLFGNAIDNAIEAVCKIEDSSRRIIGMSVKESKGMITAHIENYFTGPLHFVEELPVTTKADQRFHGFGTRSIRYIVKKYNGWVSMKAEGDVFNLNILLPVPKPQPKAAEEQAESA